MDPLKNEVGEGVRNYTASARPAVNAPSAPKEAQAVEPVKDAKDDGPKDSGAGHSGSGSEAQVAGDSKHVLTYAVDKSTHEVVARVVDAESGEVVQEFPPEAIRKAQEVMKEVSKKLFDKIA